MKLTNKIFLTLNVILILNWTLIGSTNLICGCKSACHSSYDEIVTKQESDCCSESEVILVQPESPNHFSDENVTETKSCSADEDNLKKEDAAFSIDMQEICNHACPTVIVITATSFTKTYKIYFSKIVYSPISIEDEVSESSLNKTSLKYNISVNSKSPPLYLLKSSFLC